MILRGKVINPGELRTEITLKKRVVTSDAGGFPVQTWEKIADVWARWTNAHGTEVWTADMAGAKMPATVLIRYRSDVDMTCAVEKGSQMYEIFSIDNIQERNEYLEIKVQKLGSG